MQTHSLSNAQRGYMNDPKAFRSRMVQRASELWRDGYSVSIGEVDMFHIETPKGDVYTVMPLDEGCTCAYQQQAEILQVPCKHLLGLEQIVEEQITSYLRVYHRNRLTDPTYAKDWKSRADTLSAHWRELMADVKAQTEQIREAEEQADGAAFMESINTERVLLR
jgi:hypothetical protein